MTTSTAPLVKRPLSRPQIILIAVSAVVVLTVIGLLAAFVLSGGPVGNEMACRNGEAPANYSSGGIACFTEGGDLPEGYTWDPRGNHELR